jgi:hypothetical protein
MNVLTFNTWKIFTVFISSSLESLVAGRSRTGTMHDEHGKPSCHCGKPNVTNSLDDQNCGSVIPRKERAWVKGCAAAVLIPALEQSRAYTGKEK